MGPWVLVIMFLLGGGIFTALGYASLKSLKRKRATWIETTARVVSLSEEPGDKGRTLYAPVYRYYAGGAERTVTSKIASSPAGYSVGDSIRILVDPMNPADSDVVDRTVAVFAYGMMLMGLLALAVGLLLLWLVTAGRMGFQ